MRTGATLLSLILISFTLSGCVSQDDGTLVGESDSRVIELETSQQDLIFELSKQEQTNEDLLASISQLESSYMNALDAVLIANSQTLEEINATNAASFDYLLSLLTNLQNDLSNSQEIIDQLSDTSLELENESSSNGNLTTQISELQLELQTLETNLQTSIDDLENRLNKTRAINDFSYLDFRGAQLFNFNNGLGAQMDPPIFDFAMMDNASLTYSNFSDASFVNANLAGADGIFATFHRTDFSGASMYNGIWRQSDFSDALFINSQLSYTEFRDSDLSGANLSGAVMYGGSDWLRVNLSGADLTNAWMYDVDLSYADLTGADLTGARLAYLNPSYGPADITGVTWTNAICPDGTHASTVGNTCANNL